MINILILFTKKILEKTNIKCVDKGNKKIKKKLIFTNM
jgi:hypothetical protein